MGNKLVCCRWRWIESPEFVSRAEDNNNGKYGNGYMNSHVVLGDDVTGVVGNGSKLVVMYGDNGGRGAMDAGGGYVYPGGRDVSYGVTGGGYRHQAGLASVEASSGGSVGMAGYRHQHQHYVQGATQGDGGSVCRDSWMMRSNEQLQHISEREPEDVDHDPSINARNPTLFLARSKEDIELSASGRKGERARLGRRGRRRWSSCSTVLLDDTTISQPNPALALKTLALAIHLHVRADGGCGGGPETPRFRCSREDDVYSIFDERRHPVVRQGGHTDAARAPSHREIYRFLRGIFNMAQLTPECAIVTLVYLERLLGSAEMDITPWSWRRQLLASVLLASKVWDDQAVWNADYCQILKELCVEDVNELERSFLELIQFNINVPASVYAHYYFDLLQLGRAHGLYNGGGSGGGGGSSGAGGQRPLSWHRALRLEAVNCPAGPLDDHSARWWTRPPHRCSSASSCVPARPSRALVLS